MSSDDNTARTEIYRSSARSIVLLVDDDSDFRSVVEDILIAHGFSVVTAEEGTEALELLREGLCPAAILLDLRMPQMDGRDFRHKQLEDPDLKTIPVAIMTALGEKAVESQFGDVEVIRKPVSADNLLKAVRRLCTQKGAPEA